MQARDAGGNISEKSVVVANLDSRPPVITSAIATSEEWSNTKTLTITCTDEGVGDVSIAFNDTADYKKAAKDGNTYSRSFIFTGEVYGKAKAAVYLKDAVGNVTTEFIEIYNLDNTKPVIELATGTDIFNQAGEAYAWKIDVTGNDINSLLSKAGSGITGYAVTKDQSAPSAGQYTPDAPIVTHSGKYYVWVIHCSSDLFSVVDQIGMDRYRSIQHRSIPCAVYNPNIIHAGMCDYWGIRTVLTGGRCRLIFCYCISGNAGSFF